MTVTVPFLDNFGELPDPVLAGSDLRCSLDLSGADLPSGSGCVAALTDETGNVPYASAAVSAGVATFSLAGEAMLAALSGRVRDVRCIVTVRDATDRIVALARMAVRQGWRAGA